MALRFLMPLLFLIAACSNERNPQQKADSAKQAGEALLESLTENDSMKNIRSEDTIHMITLPTVFDGDIVFQNLNHPIAKSLGAMSGSKYNHCGMIFLRAKDGMYVVIDVTDSVRITPLREWVAAGEGKQVALARFKNHNVEMNARRLEKLKKALKEIRRKPGDPYFSWGDQGFYSSEMVYKVYQGSINAELCERRSFAQWKFESDSLQNALKKVYNGTIPTSEQCVSPDDLRNSTKLEVVYER
jgi:Permuted papain-like amidase enzyme, YaeF/YiiX, C92 family